MSRLLRFNGAVGHQPAIDRWFDARDPARASIARRWFDRMRACGPDVTELLHDGHPTACIGDAAFGYVNVFTAHVNVGFFQGASLPDPEGLLQGAGRYMRHIKLWPDRQPPEMPMQALVRAAYEHMRARLVAASRPSPDGPR